MMISVENKLSVVFGGGGGRVYAILSIFFLSLFISYKISYAVDGGLLVNGGFEEGGGNSISNNWKDNSGWADIKVTYRRVFSKERKGFIQQVNGDEFNHGAVQFVQSGVSLRSGDVYKVSFWAKGDISVPLEVLFRKHGKPYTAYHSKAFKITDKWQQYSYVAPIHNDDDSAYFMFKYTSGGRIFLDDVSVLHTNFSNTAEALREDNIISNGNFEVGIDKWGLQIRGAEAEYDMPVRAMELSAEVDASRVKYGNYSLKIPSVKNSRFTLNSENVILTPGVKHSLSFWLYSEKKRKIQAGLVSGYLGSDRSHLKMINVGPYWKRYQISSIVKPSEKNAYFVVIKGYGSDAIWVDGVQLEEGGVTSFSNKAPFEIGFSKSLSHPVFKRGEDIKLPIFVAAHSQARNCKIKVDSVNYYGEKKNIFQKECNLEQLSKTTLNISHPSDKTGYFRLLAEVIVNGSAIDSSEYAIGVVPELPVTTMLQNIASPFGGHGRFTPGDLNALSKLGVKWLRMHPPLGTKWSVIEKNKGGFKYLDKEILLAKNAGFQILGSLDKTPRWASTAPENERRFWSYPPKNFDDWDRYVYNVVSHYKGVIDYWEVWNEPDSGGFLNVPDVLGIERKPDVYVELLKRAYVAAKKANPNAVIVGGVATGQPPSRWLKKIFDKGALDYMDIASFHYYTDGRPGDVLDAPIAGEVSKIASLIRQKTDRKVAIWETESGVMFPETSYVDLLEVSPSYPIPADEAVAYMIRNYVHLLSSGVEKWFYYSMTTSHRIDRREATGFFEWDGAPRPLAVAYAVLSNNLSDLVYSSSYDVNKSVVAKKFSGKNRDLLVVSAKLWKNDEAHTIAVTLSGLYSSYKVLNAMGNEVEFSVSNNSLEFDVGREPLYVIAYKN